MNQIDLKSQKELWELLKKNRDLYTKNIMEKIIARRLETEKSNLIKNLKQDEISPEQLAVGSKLIKKHFEKGIYNLTDILINVDMVMGDKLLEYFDAIKMSYASLFAIPDFEDKINLAEIKSLKTYNDFIKWLEKDKKM
jgi:hypothetical protein